MTFKPTFLLYTALRAELKPKEIFESAALPHFQKFLCTTRSLNRLYVLPRSELVVLRAANSDLSKCLIA